jgi:hypothetical protein
MKIDPKEYFIVEKVVILPRVRRFLFWKVRRNETVILKRVSLNVLIVVNGLVTAMDSMTVENPRRVPFMLNIIRLLTNIRKPETVHLALYEEAIKFNLPPGRDDKKKVSRQKSRMSIYEAILRALHPLRSAYPDRLDYYLRNFNFLQVLIDGEIIESFRSAEYAVQTTIAHSADPNKLRDNYLWLAKGGSAERILNHGEAYKKYYLERRKEKPRTSKQGVTIQ